MTASTAARLPVRLLVWVALAMLAFAGNSLLCRLALKQTSIDAATFTTVRLGSGALMLWLLVRLKRNVGSTADRGAFGSGNWLSGLALFAYAAAFSFAFVSMSAATGSLILFGAVQATMIGYGSFKGERMSKPQWLGFALALGGLLMLMLPGFAAPSLLSSLAMASAGVAWGIYSLRGKQAPGLMRLDPTQVTAGNFLRAVPMSLALSLLLIDRAAFDAMGLVYAVLSGALASGVGYTIWYQALPALKATHAATVQLSVPVIAALGGIAFIGEAIRLPMIVASVAILGGIALVILEKE